MAVFSLTIGSICSSIQQLERLEQLEGQCGKQTISIEKATSSALAIKHRYSQRGAFF